MSVYRHLMASFLLKLLLLVSSLLLLGVASAQEFYDDEPTLEQYSPLLGENFIDYPMLEEYGVPTVEEFPEEDPDENDENDEDEDEENDSTETLHKDKKDNIKHKDNEHAQKPSSALNSKSDAREKRQLPLQEDPVEIAREKLQRAIKAAQALSGMEKELGLNPATIENKTSKLETELKSEEMNFKKLADETQDQQKKAKFIKLEKDADDDVNKAENILKLIVKLEAAKFLANERAKQDLAKAQKRKMAFMPTAILGQPLSYPSQPAGYFGGIQQPIYQPPMQSYTASFQPQMFQGMSPGMTSVPSNTLFPAGIAGPTNEAPPYQPGYQDNAEIQSINAIKETQATASVLPPQSSSQQTAESVEPESTKIASFSSEAGNTDVNTKNMEFNDLPNPSPVNKPAVVQQPKTVPKTQPNAHEPANNDLKAPQMHAKPQPSQPAKPVTLAQPVLPAQPVALAQPVLPAQPVASFQRAASPAQTFESVIGQSNGLMPQTAPLTASYNPGIATTNLAPMSKYFDSSSNSPNLLAPQSFYEPMPQVPPQDIAPPTQPKKPNVKEPTPSKPAVSPLASAYNDNPQIVSPSNSGNVQLPSPAAYSSDQALSGAYPSNSFYSWNNQALQHSNPQFSWNSPMYYPAPAPYRAPVNPLIAAAYRKLHDTERANLAMSKIEEAIGLSPNSVRHVIDDIEKQAKQEEVQYEDDMSKERAEINKEKELIQNDEAPDSGEAKTKIKEDEAKLRNDIQKENVAKMEVDKIKKIEKILTIIEAAKYSAMQRAKKRINKLKGADDGTDSDDIRKRDLEDLERDIRRRKRNEINIWLKGSRNRIDTSHFIRNHFAKLRKLGEKTSRWGSNDRKLSDHSQNENLVESAVNDIPAKESTLHKLRFYKTLVSNKKLDSGKQFAVEKRTDVPEKPEKSANAFVMAKMLQKMDKLFKIQEDILKYLKAEHDIHSLQKKPARQRWRRSLHHPKHHAHKKIHKDVKRKKRKAN